MSRSQGGKANDHGTKNKDSVAGILLAHGFEEIGPLEIEPCRVNVLDAFERERLSTLGQPSFAFAGGVPICYDLFGSPFKADFLIDTPHWPEPLALVCRTQESTGSAIQKLEHLYANLYERAPCRSIVLLSLVSKENDTKTLSPETIRSVFHRAEHWISRTKGRIGYIFRGYDDFRRWLTESSPWPEAPAQQILPVV